MLIFWRIKENLCRLTCEESAHYIVHSHGHVKQPSFYRTVKKGPENLKIKKLSWNFGKIFLTTQTIKWIVFRDWGGRWFHWIDLKSQVFSDHAYFFLYLIPVSNWTSYKWSPSGYALALDFSQEEDFPESILHLVISNFSENISSRLALTLAFSFDKSYVQHFKIDFSAPLTIFWPLLFSAAKILASLARLFSRPRGSWHICVSAEQKSCLSVENCTKPEPVPRNGAPENSSSRVPRGAHCSAKNPCTLRNPELQ
jgi:hypothetical protein